MSRSDVKYFSFEVKYILGKKDFFKFNVCRTLLAP